MEGDNVICRNCAREIPENSIYCNWCGEKQLKEKKKELRVPKPRQLPSGAWSAKVTVNGERVSVTAPTEAEYYVAASAAKLGLIESTKPENRTLRQAIEAYIADSSARLDPSTVQGYESILKNSFSSLLSRKISTLTTDALQSSVDAECRVISPRTKKPYSPKTIANRYFLIAAVLHKVRPDLNTEITLPEQKRKPVQVLLPAQIYGAVKGTEMELPVLLAMWLSFSMEEIRGLTKSRSLRNGQISVTETVVDIHGQPVRKAGGKEYKRSRTLNLPPYIGELIDAVEGDVICPLSGQAMYKRFTRLLQKAGLPHMTFHQLRHVNATVMSSLNVPAKEANDRGGWSSDYVRERVYTHSYSDTRLEADRTIDAFFSAIVSPPTA